MLSQRLQIALITCIGSAGTHITNLLMSQTDQILHRGLRNLVPVTDHLIRNPTRGIAIDTDNTVIVLLHLKQSFFITFSNDNQTICLLYRFLLHLFHNCLDALPCATLVIRKNRAIPDICQYTVTSVDLCLDHAKQCIKKRIYICAVRTRDQYVNIICFFCLFIFSLFQTAGCLIRHIIQFHGSFPDALPHLRGRAVIIRIVQYPGYCCRGNICPFCNFFDRHVIYFLILCFHSRMPSAFLLRDARHAMHDIFFCASLQSCRRLYQMGD